MVDFLGRKKPKAKSQELRADFMSRPKPLVLIILDGWGYRAETKANAIALAAQADL